MTAMLTDKKKIRFQSSFLRNERSDLDKNHLYGDFVPNYSNPINRKSHGIMLDTADNGSVGRIDQERRHRHFESRSASGRQEAFNESTAGTPSRLLNVDSHHCGSNASLSPRRYLTNCIWQQPQPNNVRPSSSLPEQNQSHTTAHEMFRFVQSSVSGCLETSCERRFRRLRCLIEDQNKALESQSRKLEQLLCQIESYETATHSRRISEDGPDYICLAYLGGATEEREKENGCSKRNEEMKANERIPVTHEAEDAELAMLPAKDEDRTSTIMAGPQITCISEPFHELNEVDELKREFHLLVAISDSQNLQLLEISDEIAKHDELFLEKRLLCEHLEEQQQTNGCYEEIYEQIYCPRDRQLDITDSTGGRIESDFESEVPQNKRRADRNIDLSLKPYFNLETFLDYDTGLSSLGSDSPAELSPI